MWSWCADVTSYAIVLWLQTLGPIKREGGDGAGEAVVCDWLVGGVKQPDGRACSVMQEKLQSGDETFLMEIFKARPSLNMSLILIAVIYNVYFTPSTFKYAILMQKVKYVPAQRVHFV